MEMPNWLSLFHTVTFTLRVHYPLHFFTQISATDITKFVQIVCNYTVDFTIICDVTLVQLRIPLYLVGKFDHCLFVTELLDWASHLFTTFYSKKWFTGGLLNIFISKESTTGNELYKKDITNHYVISSFQLGINFILTYLSNCDEIWSWTNEIHFSISVVHILLILDFSYNLTNPLHCFIPIECVIILSQSHKQTYK